MADPTTNSIGNRPNVAPARGRGVPQEPLLPVAEPVDVVRSALGAGLDGDGLESTLLTLENKNGLRGVGDAMSGLSAEQKATLSTKMKDLLDKKAAVLADPTASPKDKADAVRFIAYGAVWSARGGLDVDTSAATKAMADYQGAAKPERRAAASAAEARIARSVAAAAPRKAPPAPPVAAAAPPPPAAAAPPPPAAAAAPPPAAAAAPPPAAAADPVFSLLGPEGPKMIADAQAAAGSGKITSASIAHGEGMGSDRATERATIDAPGGSIAMEFATRGDTLLKLELRRGDQSMAFGDSTAEAIYTAWKAHPGRADALKAAPAAAAAPAEGAIGNDPKFLMQSDFLKAPRAEARKALNAGSFVPADGDTGKAAIAAFEAGVVGGKSVGASAPLDDTTRLRFAVSTKGQEWALFSGSLARGIGSEDYRALVSPNGTQVRLDEALFKRLSALLDPLPKLEAAAHFGERLK